MDQLRLAGGQHQSKRRMGSSPRLLELWVSGAACSGAPQRKANGERESCWLWLMKAIPFLSLWLVGYGRWHRQWLRQEKRTRGKGIDWFMNNKRKKESELMNEATNQFRKEIHLWIEWRNGAACCWMNQWTEGRSAAQSGRSNEIKEKKIKLFDFLWVDWMEPQTTPQIN